MKRKADCFLHIYKLLRHLKFKVLDGYLRRMLRSFNFTSLERARHVETVGDTYTVNATTQ